MSENSNTNAPRIEYPRVFNLDKLPEEVAAFIQSLQDSREELDLERGGNAFTTAGGTLYGKVKDDQGIEHPISIPFWPRSSIHPFLAVLQVLETYKIAKSINLFPWPAEPAQLPERQQGDPEEEDTRQRAPARRGQPQEQQGGRRRGGATGSNGSSNGGGEGAGWFRVKSLFVKAEGGKTWLQAKLDSPAYGKFGVPSYLDSGNIPEEVAAMIESGDWGPGDKPVEGQELTTEFADMQFALVSADGKFKKITGWSSSPQ